MAERGGRISGFNHVQVVVRDMNEAVEFYRDVLGLPVLRTVPKADLDKVRVTPVLRNYFFDLGKGEMLTLIEVPDAPPPLPSFWSLWPEDLAAEPDELAKVDHIALNTETAAELEWFVGHLRSHGTKCTDVIGRSRFVKSIYFTDPTGNPLEIASWAPEDPSWAQHRAEDWYEDDDPVPALHRENDVQVVPTPEQSS